MTKGPLLLFAEDDHEDWFLIQDYFNSFESPNKLERVLNGVEMLERLRDSSKEEPDLVLLDLKMPLKGGVETLQEIKSDADLRHIPVIVLTSSSSPSDILDCYENGVNAFMTKPVDKESLRALRDYWFKYVKLPKLL